MNNLSESITNACIARGWISEQDKPWCIYAIEQKLLANFLFLFLAVLSVILGKFIETAVFACVFYFLRRRYGGWHAPSAWLCQFISIALMLSVVMLIGPTIAKCPLVILWIVDLSILVIAFLQTPIYPPQVHFDQEIKTANNKKKNQILFVVIFMQFCISPFHEGILVYSLLAVLAGILSVYIEIMRQRIKRERT